MSKALVIVLALVALGLFAVAGSVIYATSPAILDPPLKSCPKGGRNKEGNCKRSGKLVTQCRVDAIDKLDRDNPGYGPIGQAEFNKVMDPCDRLESIDDYIREHD